MANEWQSLLQQSPNIAGQDLIKNFQSAYGTAQEQKKTAYDQFRLQKAQDIVSKARRADGTMDWDAMFKLGSEAGIGLDAFNQVNKMQTERRASEVANAQNRMVLESMGYDPSRWDPSAAPSVNVPAASGVPYEGASTEDYSFLTPKAPVAQETQIPQAAPTVFGAQGVGETAQTSMPSSAPVQAGPQDIVVPGNVAPASKTGMYELPAPPMRAPEADQREGYYNELWRAQRDPEAMKKLLGAGGVTGAGASILSTAKMSPVEQENLGRYLGLRGIAAPDVQSGLTQLENLVVSGVTPPTINPMLGMMSKDEQAKEWGRYNQALADYPAKVQEARAKLSEAIRTGNYEVLDKQLAVAGNKRAEEQNKRAREQVEWPEVFSKPFESPAEKANARQASSASKGISDAIGELSGIKANDPKFPAIRMAVAKDIMIAYGLPVTEGVMSELEGLVRNGASISEIATAMGEHGIKGAVANTIGQLATQVLGLKDPTTIQHMGISAQTFANRKYKNLGVSDDKNFADAFPIAKWQGLKPPTKETTKTVQPKETSAQKFARLRGATK